MDRIMRFRFLLLFLCSFGFSSETSDWLAERPQSEEEALFLRRIADFWQEGEYQLAKIQMKELSPNFPKAAISICSPSRWETSICGKKIIHRQCPSMHGQARLSFSIGFHQSDAMPLPYGVVCDPGG